MNDPAPTVSQQQQVGRRLRIILVDDLPEVMVAIEACIRSRFANIDFFKFVDGEEAWQEIIREEPDCVVSDLVRPGVDGCELLRRLAQRRVKFPILIVSSALETKAGDAKQSAGPDLPATFLAKPFTADELCAMLEQALNADTRKATSQPQATCPLRIVHVDDEDVLLQAVEIICRGRFKELELLQFQNSVTAFRLLKQFNPDLLITDDRMPQVGGSDIVAMLAERKARFPIIVVSAWEPTSQWVQQFANDGLRISHLPAPFTIDQFFVQISKHLGTLDPPNQNPG
jgi:DNA-binding NtrC family response regulator